MQNKLQSISITYVFWVYMDYLVLPMCYISQMANLTLDYVVWAHQAGHKNNHSESDEITVFVIVKNRARFLKACFHSQTNPIQN